MENKKSNVMLMILGIISLVLITAGVTYAFFTYSQAGTTDNTLTTGSITFLYTEVDKQGAGISITDAMPTSDELGKAQTGSGNVFNFTITSTTTSTVSIPYTVTARQDSASTLDNSIVKLYLTEVDGSDETQLLLDNYSNLNNYVNAPDGTVEKVIYTDTIQDSASTSYSKTFKLRMWIDETADFSSGDYNGKTFAITVNVYANANVVSTSSNES